MLGSLDELLTGTGFSITPVVGFVAGGAFVAKPDPDEVASVFEVPLDFILDAANIDLDATASGSARAFAPTSSTTAATESGARPRRFS